MKKTLLSYEQTGSFSNVVVDYVKEAPALRPFYSLPPKLTSFPEIINQKKK